MGNQKVNDIRKTSSRTQPGPSGATSSPSQHLAAQPGSARPASAARVGVALWVRAALTSSSTIRQWCCAVSCKTRSDIPKEKIFDVVRALKSVVVPAPVHIGQILLPDAAGTGVDVVATKDVAEV